MQKTCFYFCYAVTMRSFSNRERRDQSSSVLHNQFLLIIIYLLILSPCHVLVKHINCFFYSVIISESERDEISTINFEEAQIHFLSNVFVTFPLLLFFKQPHNGFYVPHPDRRKAIWFSEKPVNWLVTLSWRSHKSKFDKSPKPHFLI